MIPIAGNTTGMRLRVVTMNVWHDKGDPGRTEAINAELRRLDPDLLALQEVLRTPENDQLARLIDGTGLHGTHQAQVAVTAPPGEDRYGGNAVATRWPHRVVEVLDLRGEGEPAVPWQTVAVTVPLPDEGEMLFIGTTLSHRLEVEAARERQAVALSELDARHRADLPTVIAGDLNATPDAASIRYLSGRQSLGGRSVYYHDAWAVAGSGPGHTWTVDNPNATTVIDELIGQPEHRRRIDYVFVGAGRAHPNAYGRIRAARLAFDEPVNGIWLSDHFGVAVDLDIGMNTGFGSR
jgi:endonuclease/exonuclease/phosphatase family metal-dependent hydrolase